MTIAIDVALAALKSGGAIVLPTDTVYGIGVDPTIPGASQNLYALKARPTDKPIPVLGPSLPALEGIAVFDERARVLAERFWPGPLTLVLERAPGFMADLGGSGDDGVAVRIPSHAVAMELLQLSGPLAVTSANLSGQPPATTVAAAQEAFGRRVSIYLDGGSCDAPASTIASLRGELEILRQGSLEGEALRSALA